MQHDDSEDEFGFWEPVGRRRAPRRRPGSQGTDPIAHESGAHDSGAHVSGAHDSGAHAMARTRESLRREVVGAVDGEPTRQLRRIDPGQTASIDHSGELRRLRVSGSAAPHSGRIGRRFGRIPPAGLSTNDGDRTGEAEQAWYLDGDLTDEHYFDAEPASRFASSDGGASGRVTVVAVGHDRRRSWRQLLSRDERGRFDPLVTRLGAIVLVGVLAIPFALAANGSSRAPTGATADHPANVAVVDVPTAAASATDAPAPAPIDERSSTPMGETASDPNASSTVAPVTPHSETAVVTGAGTPSAAPNSSIGPAATQQSSGTSEAPVASAKETKAVFDEAIDTASGADPVTTPTAAVCGPSYTIAAGDYWIGIAQRADVTLAELLHANAAAPTTALFPGRTICLPAGTAALPPAVRVTTTTAAASTTSPPAASAPATTAPTTTPAAAAPRATTPQFTTPHATTPHTTTPVTQPVVSAPVRSYSRAEVEQIIRDTWPDDQEDKAVAIATRESNLNPGVRNYCCYGLFQIYYDTHRSWLNQMGVTSAEQLFDPAVNALAALVLYNRSGGWGPWAL